MPQSKTSVSRTMKLHLAQLPRLIAERRSTAIFGVVIIAMLWGGISLKYFQDVRGDDDHRAAADAAVRGDEREAERTNRNFAMVFEENVLRSIGEIDKSLLYLRRTIETRQDTTDFHTIVNTADLLSEIIVQVAVIDVKGIMRASNAGPQPAPPIDLSDREHFRVHLNSPEDRLFISTPVIGRVSRQFQRREDRAEKQPRAELPRHQIGMLALPGSIGRRRQRCLRTGAGPQQDHDVPTGAVRRQRDL